MSEASEGGTVPCPVCGEEVSEAEWAQHVQSHTAGVPDTLRVFTKPGMCIKVIYGKYALSMKIFKVDALNPWRVSGVDALGRPIMLDLRHAFAVTLISEKQFEMDKEMAKRRANKKVRKVKEG